MNIPVQQPLQNAQDLGNMRMQWMGPPMPTPSDPSTSNPPQFFQNMGNGSSTDIMELDWVRDILSEILWFELSVDLCIAGLIRQDIHKHKSRRWKHATISLGFRCQFRSPRSKYKLHAMGSASLTLKTQWLWGAGVLPFSLDRPSEE